MTSRGGLRGLPGVRVSQHVAEPPAAGGEVGDPPGIEAGFTLTRMPDGGFDFALARCPAGSQVRRR